MHRVIILLSVFLILVLYSCQKKVTDAIISTNKTETNQDQTTPLSSKEEALRLQPSMTHYANITEWQQQEINTYVGAFNVFEEKEFVKEDFTFFPIDPTFQIIADVVLTPNTEVFEMKTSGMRTPHYREYAIMNFEFAGLAQALILYQNVDMIDHPEYGDYLFCPFYDPTNGETTYGGGRYLDVQIPEGEKILIDFNKCYNPYCAYLDKFNCPITPIANTLDIPIKAGMMLEEQH